MADEFLSDVQWRVARVVVSASAVRGQGAGVVGPARQFLAKLELDRFSVPGAFADELEAGTSAMLSVLPATRSWGLARKLLNIFLRDALYTYYLRLEFGLEQTEEHLEIPLDSITARRIRMYSIDNKPPSWKGVKHLTPTMSDAYQAAAAEIASAAGTVRVHLDTKWWGVRD